MIWKKTGHTPQRTRRRERGTMTREETRKMFEAGPGLRLCAGSPVPGVPPGRRPRPRCRGRCCGCGWWPTQTAGRNRELKLKVRDGVLEEAAKWCQGQSPWRRPTPPCAPTCSPLGRRPRRCLRGRVAATGAGVQVTDAYFPNQGSTRGFTLPAGVYRTLQVTPGGRGRAELVVCGVPGPVPAPGPGGPLGAGPAAPGGAAGGGEGGRLPGEL